MDRELDLNNRQATLGAVEGTLRLKNGEVEYIDEQIQMLNVQKAHLMDFIAYGNTIANQIRKELNIPALGDEKTKIAICGGMRSGKDTYADLLVERFGFKKFRFGDGIREVGKVAFPEAFNGKQKPRELLQGIGQQLREIDPDIWVNKVLKDIESSQARNVVISDLRQPNEYKALREAGFYIVRIIAPLEQRIERAKASGDKFDLKAFSHETESHYMGFEVDGEIHNFDRHTDEDINRYVQLLFTEALKHKDEIQGGRGDVNES